MPPRGTARLLDDMARIPSHFTLDLTANEAYVLSLFAQGHSYESAAEERGVALETVKRTARNARAKLGANNTTHAVAMAIREGVI